MPSKVTCTKQVKIIFEIVDNENIEYGFNITNYNETYSAVVVGNLNVWILSATVTYILKMLWF